MPRPESDNDLLVQACAVWRDVLKLEKIALDDDFFALGGTSIQAMMVARRVGALTGRPTIEDDILIALLERPQLRSFVAAIQGADATS